MILWNKIWKAEPSNGHSVFWVFTWSTIVNIQLNKIFRKIKSLLCITAVFPTYSCQCWLCAHRVYLWPWFQIFLNLKSSKGCIGSVQSTLGFREHFIRPWDSFSSWQIFLWASTGSALTLWCTSGSELCAPALSLLAVKIHISRNASLLKDLPRVNCNLKSQHPAWSVPSLQHTAWTD